MDRQEVARHLPWGRHQARKFHMKKEESCQESSKTFLNKFKETVQNSDIQLRQHFWRFTMSI